MAKVKVQAKQKPAARRRGRPKGGSLFTADMRQELNQAVLDADKAGTPRRAVFESFAAAWTEKLSRPIEVKQVSACFQNYKNKLNPDGSAAAPVKKSAPKSRAKAKSKAKAKRGRKPAAKPAMVVAPVHTMGSIMEALQAIDAEMASMREKMAAMDADHAKDRARADKAEKRLAQIRKAVG